MMLESFNKISNPLTIIAIFAGITEVSGTAILPFVNDQNQSIYLVFLITFPCLLVVLFFLTLNFNNRVLYAPSDYSDETNFVTLMNKQINEVEIRLAKTVKKELTEKVSDLEDNLSHNELMARARDFYRSNKYEEALDEVNRALEVKETSAALNLKAMIVSRSMKYRQAIDLCTKGLEIGNSSAATTATLYWNRACYKSLSKDHIQSIIDDLQEAILHNIEFSDKLMSDEDLEFARGFSEYSSFAGKFLG